MQKYTFFYLQLLLKKIFLNKVINSDASEKVNARGRFKAKGCCHP